MFLNIERVLVFGTMRLQLTAPRALTDLVDGWAEKGAAQPGG